MSAPPPQAPDMFLLDGKELINNYLDTHLPSPKDDPGKLCEAIRYSALAPGKRIRPLMTIAAAQLLGRDPDFAVQTAACAVELIHCYSLIHDDLPAMDDDDMRRGRPTNHKQFGEATAILAGDALLTLAFEWLTKIGLTADNNQSMQDPAIPTATQVLMASQSLAKGAGLAGMVKGQSRDLGEKAPQSLDDLEVLHAEKTGALFRTAMEVGAFIAGGSASQVAHLGNFGEKYGLAFQHLDDLDDDEHGAMKDKASARIRSLITEARAEINSNIFSETRSGVHTILNTLTSAAQRRQI